MKTIMLFALLACTLCGCATTQSVTTAKSISTLDDEVLRHPVRKTL